MERDDAWKAFLQTGSAIDYLKYKGCIGKESEQSRSVGKQEEERAGNNGSDGDCATGSSRFRLR